MKICLVFLILLSQAFSSPQFGFIGDLVGNLFGNGDSRPSNNKPPTSTRQRPSGGGGCLGNHQPNHRFGGKNYLISWRFGCSTFTQNEAESFCRNNNMRPISIDSSSKEREFLGLVSKENQRFFWTGGKVSGRSIRWPSGQRYDGVNWSNTGGANKPQPDNREGNEVCLAVLNNFYNDGVRFHDVSCHHRKPTICQA